VNGLVFVIFVRCVFLVDWFVDYVSEVFKGFVVDWNGDWVMKIDYVDVLREVVGGVYCDCLDVVVFEVLLDFGDECVFVDCDLYGVVDLG